MGDLSYEQYDLISGKVADDKVFRVVDMYHQGIWDKQRALKEITDAYCMKSASRQKHAFSLCYKIHFEITLDDYRKRVLAYATRAQQNE